jgi:hypothetical protein
MLWGARSTDAKQASCALASLHALFSASTSHPRAASRLPTRRAVGKVMNNRPHGQGRPGAMSLQTKRQKANQFFLFSLLDWRF